MATLKELAELVHGTIVGDPDLLIKGTSTIDDGKPDTITFIGYKKYNQYATVSKASAIIVEDKELLNSLNGILVKNANEAINKYFKSISFIYLKLDLFFCEWHIDFVEKIFPIFFK